MISLLSSERSVASSPSEAGARAAEYARSAQSILQNALDRRMVALEQAVLLRVRDQQSSLFNPVRVVSLARTPV